MRHLATVLFRPRRTMARILEAPNARAVLLLFVAAAISGIAGDFDAAVVEQIASDAGTRILWIIAGAVLGVLVALVLLFWFYSWVPLLIGRFLGGTGDIHGVRAAVAWGLAPAIWALLYRVPAAIWTSQAATTSVRMAEGTVAFDPGRFADGCGVMLVFAVLEVIVFAWTVFVMSNTLAEAHRYSPWQALGTLVLSAIIPFAVTLAAVLAFL